MKKQLRNLILAGLFINSAAIIAQPSLTGTNMNPSVGEMFTMNSTTVPVSPGNAGANQTWNLSALSSTSGAASTYVNAASTPSGSSFPMATLSATTAGSSTYAYYTANSTGFYHYGVVANGVVIPYSDPETILSYPFNFNSTNTDTWTSTYTSGSQIVRTGTTIITADGYGTVTTPAGTFTNVMRVHLVETYKDSSMGFVFYNYYNDEYMWYKPGIHQPLAYTYTFTINGSSGGNIGGYMVNVPTGFASFTPTSESISLFPNPSTDAITVNFAGVVNKDAEIKIRSITGQELKKVNGMAMNAGENTITVNTGDLTAGVYFMQLYIDGMLAKNERFVVAK